MPRTYNELDEIVGRLEKNQIHMYRIENNDYGFNFYLPINIESFYFDNSEFTSHIKEQLQKLYDFIINGHFGNVMTFAPYSQDFSWKVQYCNFIAGKNSFNIYMCASGDSQVEYQATFDFNVIDGKITSVSIYDDDNFGGGLTLTKIF